MAHNFWTKEEIKILTREVKKSPTNLQDAFKIVAEKTGRTVNAVSVYYHKKLKHKQNNKLFFIFSSRKTSTNYKITRQGKYATKYQPENTKPSKFKRILAILAE